MGPLEVRCPTCGAPSGMACTSVHRGNLCRKPHRQRETRALMGGQVRKVTRRQRRRPPLPETVRIAVFSRALGQCEAQPHLPTLACSGRMHYHHVLRRSQGGQDTVGNLLYVCSTHHAHIHAWPAWAYGVGLLRRRAGRRVA